MPVPSNTLPPVGVAVAAGDVITLNAWANTAQAIKAMLNFRPATGDSPTSPTIDLTTTSARALATATVTIFEDGVIDSASVFLPGLPAIQRGQIYVQLLQAARGLVLAADYVFTGYAVPMGRVTPPGPAGGHGAFTLVSLGDPGAGAEYANVILPTGAIWRARGIDAPVVNAAAAASRLFTARVNDAVGGHGLILVATGVTLTGETHTYRGFNGGPPSGVPAAMTGFADVPVAVSDRILAANSAAQPTIIFTTLNLNAGDNYGAGALSVEEWVVPN